MDKVREVMEKLKKLDGVACVNLQEPSPGDLERVVDAYTAALKEIEETTSHAEQWKKQYLCEWGDKKLMEKERDALRKEVEELRDFKKGAEQLLDEDLMILRERALKCDQLKSENARYRGALEDIENLRVSRAPFDMHIGDKLRWIAREALKGGEL